MAEKRLGWFGVVGALVATVSFVVDTSSPPVSAAVLGPGVSSVVPARVLETREGESTVDGLFEGEGPLGAGSTLELTVAGRGGVPEDADAVFVNVVATGAVAPGFFTLFPCGEDQPLAANLNYRPGSTVGNAAVVKVGTDGQICVFSRSETDAIIDVNGFVPAAAPPAPAEFEYEQFEWISNPDGVSLFDGGVVHEVSPNGRFALLPAYSTDASGNDGYYAVADRETETVVVGPQYANDQPFLDNIFRGPNMRVVDSNGVVIVGDYDPLEFTRWTPTSETMASSPCDFEIEDFITLPGNWIPGDSEIDGYVYCHVDGDADDIEADWSSPTGRFLLRAPEEIGFGALFDTVAGTTIELDATADDDWLRSGASAECGALGELQVGVHEDGSITRTFRCETFIEMSRRSADGTISTLPTVDSLDVFNGVTGVAGNGRGYWYSFFDGSMGGIRLINLDTDEMTVLAPFSGCSVVEGGGVIWQSYGICVT